MADGESSGINNPSPSSGLSIQELINGVLSHPEFRNVVSNISNSGTSPRPSSSSHSGATTSSDATSDATYQSPAEKLRGIFRRGTSTQQQQNINATLPLPRFTSRFSYQPRRRKFLSSKPLMSLQSKQIITIFINPLTVIVLYDIMLTKEQNTGQRKNKREPCTKEKDFNLSFKG